MWLIRFQAAAKRHCVCEGGLCSVSSLSRAVPHCLDPDRKPERRLFLLLCDCFLFTPAAILHAPGGPDLIRVPACSRAVPEGCVRCVAVEFPGGKRTAGGGVRRQVVVEGPIRGRGQMGKVCVCVFVRSGPIQGGGRILI